MNKKVFFLCIFALAVFGTAGADALAGDSVFGKRRSTPARSASAQENPLEENEGDSEQLRDAKRNYAAECAAVEEHMEEMSAKLAREIVAEFDKWVKAFTRKMKFEEAQATDEIKEAFASSRALPGEGECPPALLKLVRECRKRLSELEARGLHLRAEIGKKYVGLMDKEIRVFAAQSDLDSVMRFKKFRDAIEADAKNASAGGLFSARTHTADLGRGVKLELVRIPAGSFVIGSPKDEEGRQNDENQVNVTISKPFYLGKYEVKQAEWETMMGNNPSEAKGKKLPVTNITWNDVMAFCTKLTERERAAKRIPENMKYTLPTEAQWEYACRAGTKTRFYFGNASSDLCRYGNFGDKSFQEKNKPRLGTDPADKVWNDGYEKTAPVGSFRPNAWGLYDMHGNVWEWCLDYHHPMSTSGIDPCRTDPGSGSERVIRGGAYPYAARHARSARRGHIGMGNRYGEVGFRVALVEE